MVLTTLNLVPFATDLYRPVLRYINNLIYYDPVISMVDPFYVQAWGLA